MTSAIVRAKDVHEAARLTHNLIITVRRKEAEKRADHWRRIANRWRWVFRMGPLSNDQHQRNVQLALTHETRNLKPFQDQKVKCLVLMAMCAGAMREEDRVGKEAMIEIDYSDMSAIEIGWEQMMQAIEPPRSKGADNAPAPSEPSHVSQR